MFPEVADHFSDPLGTSARALRARAASATDFAALDMGELTARLERASRKRFGRDQAKALQRSATAPRGWRRWELSPPWRFRPCWPRSASWKPK